MSRGKIGNHVRESDMIYLFGNSLSDYSAYGSAIELAIRSVIRSVIRLVIEPHRMRCSYKNHFAIE